MTDQLAAQLQTLVNNDPKPTIRQLMQHGGPGIPAPEGGWSDLESARLMFGLEHDLTPEEALALEGEKLAGWRDQAERLKEARKQDPLAVAMQRRLNKTVQAPQPQRLRSGGAGSYGIGDDDALMADLKSKLGIS